jgi:23S rRNA (uracil1939-C5)-methyltransferase
VTDVVVEIERLAPGGDAVGRQRDDPAAPSAADGRVTFVPLAAPGERVRARLTREKGRVAFAELVAIERPGPARVGPECPLFGACGGCQWQHVDLPTQRAAKREIVERALGAPAGEVIAASAPFGYRDRAKLAVGRGEAAPGEPHRGPARSGAAGNTLGFRGRRSHRIVDVPACPLFGAALARALPALRELAQGLAPGTEIDVQAGAEGVHVNVSDRLDPGAQAPLAAAGVVGLQARGQAVFGLADVDVSEAGGPALRVPAGGFAQVGQAANAALVRAVLEAVGPAPGVVWELYAGSGNFTRHLAAVASALVASDADAAAVARGRRAAPAATWLVGSGVERRFAAEGPPDTVVLDPPREGADRSSLACARRARRRVVYVSCDPQTLARDARQLVAAGFIMATPVVLDLMPQTYHAEVVVAFDRD